MMKIRPYQADDRKELIALWQECGLVVAHNDPNRDIDRKLAVHPELLLIGIEDNHLMASIMGGYEGHRGWVNYLAVHQNFQRKGYGEKLMLEMEVLLKAKGCPKINLQVRTSNKDVVAFYDAIGYGQDKVVSFGKRLEYDQ